jgi:hypothetical protein
MARLEITIELDNDAFAEGSAASEVARILARIALRYEEAKTWGTWLTAHDINGNPVGEFKVSN